jgi:hypothetical protein
LRANVLYERSNLLHINRQAPYAFRGNNCLCERMLYMSEAISSISIDRRLMPSVAISHFSPGDYFVTSFLVMTYFLSLRANALYERSNLLNCLCERMICMSDAISSISIDRRLMPSVAISDFSLGDYFFTSFLVMTYFLSLRANALYERSNLLYLNGECLAVLCPHRCNPLYFMAIIQLEND